MSSILNSAEQATIHDNRIGIIDIGSNSIRLVVYDQIKRAPIAICNEKAVCTLGRGLASSGKLNPEGVELARAAVKRFLTMARQMDVTELIIIATAAVRDASDGADFVAELEREHHIDITTITGNKEAKLGAYGIFSSMFQPKGITGDLGGGSMEFVQLGKGEIAGHTSIPIGPLRLLDEYKGDRDKMKRAVEKGLKSIEWLPEKKQAFFYAIGGSFRALAKMHQAQNNYPLRMLHGYTLPAKEMQNFTTMVSELSEDKIAAMPGASSKRVFMLVPASIVLSSVLEQLRIDKVVFSTSGIREGLLYERLSPFVREQDALLGSATDLAIQHGRPLSYGNELFLWLYPIFSKENETLRRLRMTFCQISEIAWNLHPEYRAEGAFRRVLYSSLLAITHEERLLLALALYHRHQGKLKDNFPETALMNDKQRLLARVLGTAASLAYQLSGAMPGHLHKSTLRVEKGQLSLTLSPAVDDLMSDAVRKRMETLNDAFKSWSK